MNDDTDYFHRLVVEHQAAIRGFAASRIGDPFEAHDIAQEVFIVAFRKIDEVDRSQSLRPWLYQIAANLIRNHRKKKRAFTVDSPSDNVLELLTSEIDAGNHGLQDDSLLEALDGCLSKLEGKARELVRMRYEDGLGISEIRASHGGGHSAMTMKLHRLRERLRLCVEQRVGVSHG